MGDYYATEQTPLNLHGTGISVADIDGDSLTVTVTVTGAGASQLSATVGTTGVVMSGAGSNTLILTGTATQLNNLFAGNNGSTLTYYLPGDTPVATRLLTISASDGSLSGADTAIIHIAAVNDGPVNNAPVTVITDEDTALVFSAGNGNQIRVNDLDAGSSDLEVTLSVTNGTLTLAGITGLVFSTGDGTADSSLVFRGTQANINAAIATLTFNPTANYHGTAVLTITTSDLGNSGTGGTLTDSDNINITVTAINDAPTVANPIPNQTVAEGSAFNFQFSASAFADVDVDVLTFTAQLADGSVLPTWLSFDSATRTFSGTPTNGDVEILSINVTADDNNNTVTDNFTLTVTDTNDAPTVANPIADQTASEDSAFNFTFAANTFADIDAGNVLIYSAQLANGSALPAWLSFNAATRTFSGTPLESDAGNIVIVVNENDGNGGSVSDNFVLSIQPTNDAPETVGLSAVNNIEDAAGDTVDLFAAFTDDRDAPHQLHYSVVSNSNPTLVAGAVIDPVTGHLQLSYAANQFGTSDFIIRAQDSQGANVETSLRINIAPVNDTPTSTGIADVKTQAGSSAQQTNLHSVFSDVEDAEKLLYSLVGHSNPAVATVQINPATGMMNLIFAAVTGGESVITLRATDTDGTWIETCRRRKRRLAKLRCLQAVPMTAARLRPCQPIRLG